MYCGIGFEQWYFGRIRKNFHLSVTVLRLARATPASKAMIQRKPTYDYTERIDQIMQ
jgi:hypothetical protein